jgi:hypothetical protein
MKNIEKNLFSKHRLTFGEDGKFRILMVSDLQETLDCNPRTLLAFDAMCEAAKPGLVILGGDNCNGKVLRGEENLRQYIKKITEPLERRGIPWAHIFGNHDRDTDVPADVQQKIYESMPHCVSKHTGAGVSGKSNFTLPVWGRSGELKFFVWGLDSNNRWKNFCADTGLDPKTPYRFTHSPVQCERWDVVRFDQQMWYYKSSLEIEKREGRKIPGMLVTHIAPHEFQIAKDNPGETLLSGSSDEVFSLGALNSGIFATILERGDIKTIACGHTHENDFEAEYLGVRLCLDACGGFSPYGVDSRRGGRVFELSENTDGVGMRTYMLRALDLM